MSDRSTHGDYTDPVDLIWHSVARTLGFRIHRSDEAYASFDGKSQMTICTKAEFDPDDSLAQMVLHEMCHALVGGKKALQSRDWGLSSDQGEDLLREYATHRLQASLSDRFGLRELFAVTTQWRPHFDALGDDPLHGDDPSVEMAKQGLENARAWGWEEHILNGLRATAQIADAVRPYSSSSSLWSSSRPLHPTGFILAGNSTCGSCAWALSTSDRGIHCQQLQLGKERFVLLHANTPSCERFETSFSAEECGKCGACCREGFDAVPVDSDEALRKERPDLLEQHGDFVFLPRPGGHCSGLQWSEDRIWRCGVYEMRPRSCRDLEMGSLGCLQARQRAGLSRG